MGSDLNFESNKINAIMRGKDWVEEHSKIEGRLEY